MGLEFSFGDLEQRLLDLGKKASNEMTEKALRAGAKVVLKDQELNVPINTGHLKSRLDIKRVVTGKGTKRKLDVGILNNEDRSATYGYYQEHGTRRQVGKKWMKRSFQNSVKDANEEIKKVIVEEILK